MLAWRMYGNYAQNTTLAVLLTCHNVHLSILVTVHKKINGILESGGVQENCCDVPKQNALLGEVCAAFNVAKDYSCQQAGANICIHSHPIPHSDLARP